MKELLSAGREELLFEEALFVLIRGIRMVVPDPGATGSGGVERGSSTRANI
jgi:hypothetical protein